MSRKSDKNKQQPFRSNNAGGILAVIADNKKIIMPAVLLICVVITIVIALNANKAGEETTASGENAASTEESYIVTEEALATAGEEVTTLVNRYYTAYADGDLDTISEIYEGMSKTEQLRIQESSKFIESIETEVYTKAGPTGGTYLAYVYEKMKFYDYEEAVPGMQSLYICTREDGSLYINDSSDVDQAVLDYITEVNQQSDIVDLNNKVAAEYNEMLSNDPDLETFLTDFVSQLNQAAGEALASEISPETVDGASDDTEESSENDDADAGQTQETEETETASTTDTIEATDVVMIRSSDSTEADRLGKTSVGQQFTRLETLDNGWSKIEYNGGVAYVKTEFFKVVSTGNESTTSESTGGDSTSTLSAGTHHVKETVRIRKSASTDSEQVGSAYGGDSIEVVQVQSDGWSQVKYGNISGYVKTEFLTD